MSSKVCDYAIKACISIAQQIQQQKGGNEICSNFFEADFYLGGSFRIYVEIVSVDIVGQDQL